jgi:hypothetical protein
MLSSDDCGDYVGTKSWRRTYKQMDMDVLGVTVRARYGWTSEMKSYATAC